MIKIYKGRETTTTTTTTTTINTYTNKDKGFGERAE